MPAANARPPVALGARQVHLDFHTSPHIPGVGADFDAEEFADTLARAGVDSVTCFARCHHGMIYYDTAANPERVHPHLARPNLLAEQIEACHARGIRVPVYTTVQWDAHTADEHRDWMCVDADGKLNRFNPLGPGFYGSLDVFHPGYRAFLRAHVADLFDRLPAVDGLFFDITQNLPSCAAHWLAAMDAEGLDAADLAVRRRFAERVMADWQREMTAYVRGLPAASAAACSIFYNAGHVGPRIRSMLDAYTHLELESLPSGGWGYLHFPLSQRFARTIRREGDGAPVPTLGMTGKFQTTWADFGSYKNPAALEFECFHAAALGAASSVGDQLHPSGKIDAATYDLIGGVYRPLAAMQPWLDAARPIVEAAVMTPEEFGRTVGEHLADSERTPAEAMGALRMFQELGLQFDMVDSRGDFGRYPLLVLPDVIPVDEMLAERLRAYLAGGGNLIVTGRSGLTPDGSRFALDELGVEYVGPAPFSPDFLVPTDAIGRGLPRVGHVMYNLGVEVRPAAGAEVLASVEVPYFNRTREHYCSHQHTPSSGRAAYPGVVAGGPVAGGGRCVYFAHPLFTTYYGTAPRWCKAIVADAVDRLLPTRLVRTDGPSSLLSSLMRQERKGGRRVLHLLHYVPERRAKGFDVIEDVIPLHDVSCDVAGEARSVRVVPGGEALAFTSGGGRVRFALPRLVGHAAIEIA